MKKSVLFANDVEISIKYEGKIEMYVDNGYDAISVEFTTKEQIRKLIEALEEARESIEDDFI